MVSEVPRFSFRHYFGYTNVQLVSAERPSTWSRLRFAEKATIGLDVRVTEWLSTTRQRRHHSGADNFGGRLLAGQFQRGTAHAPTIVEVWRVSPG